MTSRMFPFVSQTLNICGGKCPYNCVYCWAKMLANKNKLAKYLGEPKLFEKELKRKVGKDDFVFLQDMNSLLALPDDLIRRVLQFAKDNPETQFLLLDKNPQRYIDFIFEIPENCVIGTTIESNINYYKVPSKYPHVEDPKFTYYGYLSRAPLLINRLVSMQEIRGLTITHRLFVSIEPILDFTEMFVERLKIIKPWAVAIGYDNYNFHLPEPSIEKTEKLIEELEKFTTVYRKTIRKAWWEK